MRRTAPFALLALLAVAAVATPAADPPAAAIPPDTADPAPWGKLFPRQYDSHRLTAGTGARPPSKLDGDPRLRTLFAGNPFAADYRERRGHAHSLADQDASDRTKKFAQLGACLHCHASVIPAYRAKGREAGVPDERPQEQLMKGFEVVCRMPLAEARRLKGSDGKELVAHPVSCIDCHDPRTMGLRVARPAFLLGMQALARSDEPVPHLPSVGRWRKGDRKTPYDANTATKAELRSFVCGQCHSEYYFRKDTRLVTHPWDRGLAADKIAEHYDALAFADWTHETAGTPALKAQHPEFETWSRGSHAAFGLSCADCHMPTTGEGKETFTSHHIRSPLAHGARSCRNCHRDTEAQLRDRVADVQGRARKLLDRAEDACAELIRAIAAAKARGATDAALKEARALHRAAQWRADFVLSENGRGFHAPQEAARVLGEALELAVRGRMRAVAAR